jgi:predicted house-cleaning NTP pyrophosphatase (Maf/HAM1 superfamily)
MIIQEKTLTTVKIPKLTYEDFRVLTKMNKMSLQDLTDRAVYLYVVDSEFRHKIHCAYNTYYTGSAFVESIKHTKTCKI